MPRTARRVLVVLLIPLAAAACQGRAPEGAPPPDAAAPSAARPAATVGPQQVAITRHLGIDGTRFVGPDGRPFLWRGITSFRLLEMLAAGRADEADAYLAWTAGQKLNVVRVLTMAKHLFVLPPEKGRAVLEDLLQRAARYHVYVEIVALADTAEYPVSLEEQVRAIGAIAAQHPNAIVEIANEPYHPTQRAEVQDPSFLARLLPLVPDSVPVALGAWHELEHAAAGEFVTFHFPRSVRHDGWGHVSELQIGRELQTRFGKPVVNDEPIGAGATFQPGRRDDDPNRFRAAGLLTRMLGMGGTFHYEGGLQSAIPSGRELECFNAWQEAWDRLPADLESWQFRAAGETGAAAAKVNGTIAGAWAVQRGNDAWVLIAGERGDVTVDWAPGWRQAEAAIWPGSRLLRASRTQP